jgi:integrase
MLEQGVPLKVVTERLGHSSTRITADLYQHVGETMQDDAAAKLGAALLE